MTLRIRGIHHAGLVVRDLDAAVAFYAALLDMQIVESVGLDIHTLRAEFSGYRYGPSGVPN